MKFEDTGFADCPALRRAFTIAEVGSAMGALSNPHLTDDGLNPTSLKLKLRAAEILRDNVPGADPEVVAGAMLFPTQSFSRSGAVLLKRGSSDTLPRVGEWSAEWCEVQRGAKRLEQASPELRQIVTAANCAILEGMKNNISVIDHQAAQRGMAEYDLMIRRAGDCGAPALTAAYHAARNDLDALLPKQPQPGGRGAFGP